MVSRVAVMLLALVLLSGCQSVTLDVMDVADSISKFESYTWPPLVRTNGTGAIVQTLDAPGSNPALPYYVQQRLNVSAGEPNIGATSSRALFLSAVDEVMRSKDHGRTWQEVYSMRSFNYPVSKDYRSSWDPGLWVDPATSRIFSYHLTGDCVFVAWSDRDGEPGSWTENPRACFHPFMDHQKLMTAPYGPKSLKPVLSPYPNVVYVCYNQFSSYLPDARHSVTCMVSLDGGRSFSYERQALDIADFCPSINGHPAAYADGTVVVPIGLNFFKQCKRSVTVTVTEDNGLTWTPRAMPGTDRMQEVDPDIATTPDGVAYLVYRDQSEVLKLVRSRDKFRTWEGPWRVAPADHQLSVFSVIAAGDNGRIAIAYHGTRTPQAEGATPASAAPESEWHLFVSTSLDANGTEPTFVTQQVTPTEDPVQIGCAMKATKSAFRCGNLLDFMDLSRDADGRVYAAFTDGCTARKGCTGDRFSAEQSYDSEGAVAIQVSGPSLLEGSTLIPFVGFQHPKPLPEWPSSSSPRPPPPS